MVNKDMVIGMIGGMGTYATIHAFKQYATIFPANKEWERPRIIIDNRCTMPSRVRAYLYNEKVDELVCELSESVNNLIKSGANKIILACNTSHLFIPKIIEHLQNNGYDINPNVFENIIDNCAKKLNDDGIGNVCVLGSEGTLDSGIYQKALSKYNIKAVVPSTDDYSKIRNCIECVKQNLYDNNVKEIFCNLLNNYNACILGCTELPILYEMFKNDIICKRVYDPIEITLNNLYKEFMND